MAKLQIRGDTTANWSAANPVLANRELAVDTTLNKLKVGNGVTAWNSLGFCGGGGMWELVERWEPTEAATSHTFSGLNGDVDRRYMIHTKTVGYGAGTNVLARYNNDSGANYRQIQTYAYGPTGDVTMQSETGMTGFPIGWNKANDINMSDCYFEAKSGTVRVGYSDMFDMNPTESTIGRVAKAFLYSNTTDNITSISIYCANDLLVGSYIELWKLAQ